MALQADGGRGALKKAGVNSTPVAFCTNCSSRSPGSFVSLAYTFQDRYRDPNDSVTQVVKYQRNIGALPPGTGFSVRTHWASPLSGLGGSVRNYLTDYKGVITYTKLMGFRGVTTDTKPVGPQDMTQIITGVMPDLLNGVNANDASQSASWLAIMDAIQKAYNTANGTGYSIAMDWFNILSPASTVANLCAGYM